MKTILEMLLIGFIAGLVVCFWTRIIKDDMIFSFVGNWLNNLDKSYTINKGQGYGHPIATFIRCGYCLTPWLVILISMVYISYNTPIFYLAVAGLFAALGAGNLVCELVRMLRNV